MSETEYEQLLHDAGVKDELPDFNEATVDDDMAELKQKSYDQLVTSVEKIKILVVLNFIVMIVVLLVVIICK
jgi:hypothetical protein